MLPWKFRTDRTVRSSTIAEHEHQTVIAFDTAEVSIILNLNELPMFAMLANPAKPLHFSRNWAAVGTLRFVAAWFHVQLGQVRADIAQQSGHGTARPTC